VFGSYLFPDVVFSFFILLHMIPAGFSTAVLLSDCRIFSPLQVREAAVVIRAAGRRIVHERLAMAQKSSHTTVSVRIHPHSISALHHFTAKP